TVAMSGDVPEATLVTLSHRLRDKLEALPGVLEAEIGGDREQVMEIIVQPRILETYNLSFETLLSLVQRNNKIIAAGALDTGAGRFAIKVPGVIETVKDMLTMPIKVHKGTVVTFGDVATVRRTFKDPTGFARIDGKPAVTLEIRKRTGANIIETVAAVKRLMAEEQKDLPAALKVSYLQDKSRDVRSMLGDLENNVLTGVILVMIVIVASLGLRSSILVGLSIPGSFLAGILILNLIGVTMNIVVLFSLILVVGMLVDGAIVTTELADRRMAEGDKPPTAFAYAAKRMSWPVIASTVTTLAVFLPLMAWPGVVGEFMKFLPLTVLITLTCSLLMALVFIPVLGGIIGRSGTTAGRQLEAIRAAETGDLDTIHGFSGWYVRRLRWVAGNPGKVFLTVIALMVGTYVAYGMLGRGVEFFPKVEPNFAQVQVRVRGDLSIHEKDKIVAEVGKRIADMRELRAVYERTIGGRIKAQITPDTVGIVQLEFIDWDKRRPAQEIMADIRERLKGIPGIVTDVQEARRGPASGKPIKIDVSSRRPGELVPAIDKLRRIMREIGGIVEIEDNRALPGIEWRLVVDRDKAARFGADVASLGQVVQLVTRGVKVAEYRPDDADEEEDIVLRFPASKRSLEQLSNLRVPTSKGLVPIANFVTLKPAPKTGTIERINSRRTITIQADVAKGALVDDKVRAIQAALKSADLPQDMVVAFKGETKDQKEAMTFLMSAFGIALFLMILVLVTQFNSLYQAGLVLSAILFSTAGVLVGLMITGQTFGIVMVGLGVIALAGIVVNNNIVLIDTFNDLRKSGLEPLEAILRTGAQRLRPVMLTSITTVLGLMPMVLAVNVDIVNRDINIGAPSTQWWTQLSSAIAGGLTFATVLTLVLTPALLMMWERRRAKKAAKRASGRRSWLGRLFSRGPRPSPAGA
ncbi:MAG: efflux RND transporter permease subunit, partial [Bauldia litoralis]